MRILIDAGHGGRDSGAINRKYGFEEKDFALDVARQIEEGFIGSAWTVEMTRRDDRFISLSERLRIARDFQPDIFLSVHHNARPEGSPAWIGFEFESFYRTGKRGSLSSAFGAILNRRVLHAVENHGMRVRDRGVKEANFMVLLSPGAAVLGEYGFITDDEEALFLAVHEHRQLLAWSTIGAIEEFIATKEEDADE